MRKGQSFPGMLGVIFSLLSLLPDTLSVHACLHGLEPSVT